MRVKYVAPEPPDSIDAVPLTEQQQREWLNAHRIGTQVAHGGTVWEVIGVNASQTEVHGFDRGVFDFDNEVATDEITYGDDVEWEF